MKNFIIGGSAMIDKNKINAIKAYLIDAFPESKVDDKYDFDLGAQSFKIHFDKDLLLLKVDESFIDDNNEEEIKHVFDNKQIKSTLLKNKDKSVFIGSEGVKIKTR
ncbi:MAG: hypothetical protein ACYC25_12015 [Paludibacter sp.]